MPIQKSANKNKGDGFDRNSAHYKQFVRCSRRTSTPQLTRPKNIRSNIQCDLPMSMRAPPRPPKGLEADVDFTYVSYVQWRHYLVVPNSARKFKVRCSDPSVNVNKVDKAISGNINMHPYPPSQKLTALKEATAEPKIIKPKVESLLNSRIMEDEAALVDFRIELAKRNQRIVDAVLPLVKKNLMRIFAGNIGRFSAPVRNKTAKLFGIKICGDRQNLLDTWEDEE